MDDMSVQIELSLTDIDFGAHCDTDDEESEYDILRKDIFVNAISADTSPTLAAIDISCTETKDIVEEEVSSIALKKDSFTSHTLADTTSSGSDEEDDEDEEGEGDADRKPMSEDKKDKREEILEEEDEKDERDFTRLVEKVQFQLQREYRFVKRIHT